MTNSHYSSSIKELVDQSPETILGHLAKQNSFSLQALQRNAWLAQISILKRELPGLAPGWVAFEFAIPRMGKRPTIAFCLEASFLSWSLRSEPSNLTTPPWIKWSTMRSTSRTFTVAVTIDRSFQSWWRQARPISRIP